MGLLDIYYASQGQLTVNDPDLVTQYPATVTGTPNASQNPGAPPRNFDQPYTSNDTYLAVIAANLTRLQATLPITNFDVEDPGVQGGPNADITTRYPALVTGTPTNTQNPGGPVRNFRQPWLPNITYLNANPIAGLASGELRNTLPITNFDVEDPSVNGGPNADITTRYPANVTGTPTNTQNPGGPVRNFSQPWLPNLTYIITNPVAGPTSGELRNTLPITNLDVEDPGVLGGPNADIITVYPPLVTGTPNTTQNVGLTAPFVSGAPPQRFSQLWLPNITYLNANPVAGATSGELRNTLPITNFDVDNSGVQGGPIPDTITIYPPTVTGTPTPTQNIGLTPPFISGAPPKRFNQPWLPNLTYLSLNPVATLNSGQLYNTLPITNLDTLDPGVQGGPLADTITNYRPLVTGTPNYGQNPGAPPRRYSQNWNPRPFSGYLDYNPIKGPNSGRLFNVSPFGNNSLKITNLDTTEPGVQGGIPYNQLNDPTIYPLTSNHTEGHRGWFPTPASASGKFYQNYNAANTYNDFIQAYI